SLKSFAEQLIERSPSASPQLPDVVVTNLPARAQFVEDVCREFLHGWREDRWTSVEIGLGMAHLNLMWQRSGRVMEPSNPRQCVAIVMPPNSGEILGAIVKADVLRAAGISVRMVRVASTEATLTSLLGQRLDAIIVAGSRVGWSADQKRARHLAHAIGEQIQAIPIYIGGRSVGSLDGWPERISSLRENAVALNTADIDWLALADLASQGRVTA
ncbi:MAG: hypothetical protein AAFR09_05100, partial [Pseudomonadota bacterium]